MVSFFLHSQLDDHELEGTTTDIHTVYKIKPPSLSRSRLVTYN